MMKSIRNSYYVFIHPFFHLAVAVGFRQLSVSPLWNVNANDNKFSISDNYKYRGTKILSGDTRKAKLEKRTVQNGYATILRRRKRKQRSEIILFFSAYVNYI